MDKLSIAFFLVTPLLQSPAHAGSYGFRRVSDGLGTTEPPPPSEIIKQFTDEYTKTDFSRTPLPSGTVFTDEQKKSWTLLYTWRRISGFDYPDGKDETNFPPPQFSGPFPAKKEVRLYSHTSTDHPVEYHVVETTTDNPSDIRSLPRDNVANVYDASLKLIRIKGPSGLASDVPASFTYYNTINGEGKVYQEICRISAAAPNDFISCRVILKGEWFNYMTLKAIAQ